MGWQEQLAWPRLLLFLALVAILLTFAEPYARQAFPVAPLQEAIVDKDTATWCPLPAIHAPLNDGLHSSALFSERDLVQLQVQRLAAAVNISTVSYVDNGDDLDEDLRWTAFEELHNVLRRLFPLV